MKDINQIVKVVAIVASIMGASYLASCETEQARVNSGARDENGRVAPRDGHHRDCQYRHTNNYGLECYR